MRSRLKKFFNLGMTALLLLSVVSGCRYVPDTPVVQRIERKPRSEYEQDYDYDFYSRDKLEIRIMAPIDDSKFSEENNLIPQIEEATNTKLSVTFVAEDAYADRLATSLSGDDTPELFCRVTNRQALIKDGAAYPLYDILMQYAPNYLDLVESYNDEDMLLELTDVETFEIYTMMNIRQPECQLSFLIRQD